MSVIIVAKDGSGDFTTVQEALDKAVPGDLISVRNGVYKERIEARCAGITLEGEDKEKTVITEGYYAEMIMEDGSKRGTFRSYTALFNFDNIAVRNITIENSAGFGTKVGQAIAVYAEGDGISFTDCRILGHQDTLFTGPLPFKEKIPGGFTGPTQFATRKIGRQSYERCYICGEIDFIFGSAIAYFHDCELYALDRDMDVNAFYTAPSTYEGSRFGYVFDSCRFTGNCPKGTAYLGRPWREYARAVFISCDIDEGVNELGFDDWKKTDAHDKMFFAEYNCRGAGSDHGRRASFAHTLNESEAAEYTKNNVLAPLTDD